LRGRVSDDGLVLTVQSPGQGATEVLATTVVNAAALYATAVARSISGLDTTHIPIAHFAKGSYYTLEGRAPFSRLVYPAPQDAWLGVHLTLDLGGQAKFGPDLEWLSASTPDAIDYTVDPERARGFYAEVRRYWPGLPDGALSPGYSGVRPKIYGPGQAAPDFRIDGPVVHGVPGLVNLFGIESPGLTSSLAIGEHVARLLA
jgi:L-2-hydroxyglutarate oxidase LhgO